MLDANAGSHVGNLHPVVAQRVVEASPLPPCVGYHSWRMVVWVGKAV